MAAKKITPATVRADFNDPVAVIHYARAAHFMGLWASERVLIGRYFTDLTAPLLEAGCGAGRATLGLWDAGYKNLTAFDFAAELIDQARSLATTRGAAASPASLITRQEQKLAAVRATHPAADFQTIYAKAKAESPDLFR